MQHNAIYRYGVGFIWNFFYIRGIIYTGDEPLLQLSGCECAVPALPLHLPLLIPHAFREHCVSSNRSHTLNLTSCLPSILPPLIHSPFLSHEPHPPFHYYSHRPKQICIGFQMVHTKNDGIRNGYRSFSHLQETKRSIGLRDYACLPTFLK